MTKSLPLIPLSLSLGTPLTGSKDLVSHTHFRVSVLVLTWELPSLLNHLKHHYLFPGFGTLPRDTTTSPTPSWRGLTDLRLPKFVLSHLDLPSFRPFVPPSIDAYSFRPHTPLTSFRVRPSEVLSTPLRDVVDHGSLDYSPFMVPVACPSSRKGYETFVLLMSIGSPVATSVPGYSTTLVFSTSSHPPSRPSPNWSPTYVNSRLFFHNTNWYFFIGTSVHSTTYTWGIRLSVVRVVRRHSDGPQT